MTDSRHRRKTAFLLAASLLWMAFIFAMSARPADVSSQDSGRVGRLVLMVFRPGFRDLPAEEQEVLVRRVDGPVRRCAHAAEYAVLGILAGLTIQSASGPRMKTDDGGVRRSMVFFRRFPLPAAWLAAVIYACTDELHQAFVPGRSCRAIDLATDAAGAAAGILVLFLISRRKGGAQR